jgi:hypothetical protein
MRYTARYAQACLGSYTTKEEAALQYTRQVTAVRTGIHPCCAAAVLDGDVGIACGGAASCGITPHARGLPNI